MKIIKPNLLDIDQLWDIYTSARQHLRSCGIFQWDEFYPNRFVLQQDLQNGELYAVVDGARFVGAVSLNDTPAAEYASIKWESDHALIIHRLVVDPKAQGKGFGKRLLQFSEEYAIANGYTCIHLDAYSGNEIALNLYERNGYERRGEVTFPFRELPYICFEKTFHILS
jgi:ribosomal protein S18 acetylase RimI-like enzyme